MSRAAQPCQCGERKGSLEKLGPELLGADQIDSVALWFVSAVATNCHFYYGKFYVSQNN